MPLPMAIRVTNDGFPNNLASHDPGWADMVNPNHPPNHIMIGAVRTDRTEKNFARPGQVQCHLTNVANLFNDWDPALPKSPKV